VHALPRARRSGEDGGAIFGSMAKPRFVVKTLAWSAANVHTLTPLPQFTCRPIVLTYPMHHCNSLMSPQCSLMKKTQFWPGTSQIYLHGLNVQGIAHKLCHCVTCLTAYPQGHLIRTVKALNCKANRDLVDSTNASADAHAGVFKLGEVAYQIRVCLLLSNCDYDTRCANDRRQAKGAPPNLSFSLQDPTGDCKGFLSEEMETNAVIGAEERRG
jgi:hypothetical protein